MPVQVSVSARARVTAGLAKDAEAVKKMAAPIQAPTAPGTASPRSVWTSAKMTSSSPPVATASPATMPRPSRGVVATATAARLNIRLVATVPTAAPAT